MKKILLLLVLIPFMSAALAQNDVKKAAKHVDKVLDQDQRADWDNRDKGDWDDGLRKDLKKNGKGGGKPNNPGAHGRANAEYKKATNPGKGGGKNKSHGGGLLGDLIDDDDNKGGKDGKNGKNGKKEAKKK